MNSQVQVRIRSRTDEERTPTRCSIIIDLRQSFVYAEVYAFKVTSLQRGFCTSVHSFLAASCLS